MFLILPQNSEISFCSVGKDKALSWTIPANTANYRLSANCRLTAHIAESSADRLPTGYFLY